MIETDDLIYRVDNHYLGPTGKTLPFPIRYSAVGVGASTFFVLFLVARAILHLSMSYYTFLLLVVGTVAISSRITKYINPDRPLRSVIKAAYNDLTSPRPPKPGKTVSVRLPALSARTSSTDPAAPATDPVSTPPFEASTR
jgi:hypothetical protein